MTVTRSNHVETAGETAAPASTSEEREEDENAERTLRSHANVCETEEQEVSKMRVRHGFSLPTRPAMGVRLLQLYRLRAKSLTEFQDRVDRRLDDYLTRMANLPATFIPINRATSEFVASRTTTNPDQSSLRLLDLQLGQTGPLLIIRHVLQAFSVKPYARPSPASPSTPPESTPASLGMVGAA